MPIYGYECTECGHQLEVLQSVSEPPLQVCPECSGRLRKLLYPVGVIFKGSGFYTTDYKSSGASGNGRGSSKSSAGESGGGTSDAKSDAKSDSKSESKGDSKGSSEGSSKGDSKPASD